MGSQQQYCLRWNNHQSNILSVFDSLFQNEAMVDVTLACEGLSIKAHKMVLSACSPYFQSLFMENPCKHPIVILKDVSFADLKALMDFMYRGEVNVNQEQLDSLLKTAETLKVRGLTEVATNAGDLQNSMLNQEREVTHLPPHHLAGIAPPQPSTHPTLVHTLNRSSPSPKRRKKMPDQQKANPSPSPSELEDSDNVIEPKIEIKESQQSNELMSKIIQAALVQTGSAAGGAFQSSLVHSDQAPSGAFQSNGSQGLPSANDASPSVDQNFTVRPNEAVPQLLYKSSLCQPPGMQGDKDVSESFDTVDPAVQPYTSLEEPDVEITAIDNATDGPNVNPVSDPHPCTAEEPDPSAAKEPNDSASEKPGSVTVITAETSGIQKPNTQKFLEITEIPETVEIDKSKSLNSSIQKTQHISNPPVSGSTSARSIQQSVRTQQSLQPRIMNSPMQNMVHFFSRARMMQQSSVNALIHVRMRQQLPVTQQPSVQGRGQRLPMPGIGQHRPIAQQPAASSIRQQMPLPTMGQHLPASGIRQQMPLPTMGQQPQIPRMIQRMPVPRMMHQLPIPAVRPHSSVPNVMRHTSASQQSQVQVMQRLMIHGNLQRLPTPRNQ